MAALNPSKQITGSKSVVTALEANSGKCFENLQHRVIFPIKSPGIISNVSNKLWTELRNDILVSEGNKGLVGNMQFCKLNVNQI